MASFAVSFFVALLVAAVALRVMRNRTVACWLLVLFPALFCALLLKDLAGGMARLGQAAFESDQKQLLYSFFLLALSLTSALRSNWAWLFWIAWIFNAAVCGILVYLEFFWKVFS
ncbi:MAG TPA: hypothetical protein VKR52_10535 [Terracidiphilus sp.]|nr:hypothetical protein [Terracidiphilus sp.]